MNHEEVTMNINKIKLDKTFKTIAQAFMFFAIATNAQAALTGLSTSPLVTSSSSSVLPNLLMVLDDSGSMDWDFMPDWANSGSTSLFRNADYNGIAYNPATTYNPPIFYDASGTANTTTYPSQTGTSPATGGNASATLAAPNWKQVKDDAYGIQSTSNSDLTNSANFYTFLSGESCTAANLKTCVAGAPSATYPFPAKLRWCNLAINATAASPAAGSCQAVRFEVGPAPLYDQARYPKPRTATITIISVSSTTVSSIKVNGLEILSGTTASSSTDTTVASRIAANINNCTFGISGNCTVVGYSASSGGGTTVTITAPGAITYTPVITSGGVTITAASAFVQGTVPGDNLLTVITPTVTSYPYPGTAAKASTRTDCAGTTCTYAEEMTNYANWWTYYHTRMQMMKTAATSAFATLSANYRVGYMSINDNTGNDFLNLDAFTGTQKGSWYAKFIAAYPNNSTPLRTALTKAGRLYAGQLDGTTLNGSTVVDPLQYSCQQNFTILSTDGYWNDSSGAKKIDGTTNIGNADGAEPRPFNDGATQLQSTSQLQTSQTQVAMSTSQIQKSTSNLQQTTTRLRKSTSSNSGYTWSSWSNTGSCTWDTSGTSRTQCAYNGTVTGPTNVGSCIAIDQSASTSGGTVWTGNKSVCQYTAFTAYAGASSCTAVAQSPGPTIFTVGTAVQCPTPNPVTTGPTFVASCTPAAASAGNGYTVTTCTTTPYLGSVPTGVSSCTAGVGLGPDYVHTNCNTVTTGPTVVAVCTPDTASASNDYTTTTCAAGSGGTSNTLADVAEYYYATDLRTVALGNCTGTPVPPSVSGNTLCSTPVSPATLDPLNNVPKSGDDANAAQHMTTFTLGLGASGYMQYDPNYALQSSGDYFDVKKGNAPNPPDLCGWQASGSCNWPVPVSNVQTTVDDLWHAGVNGRGAYFSATNPATLSSSLSTALAGVTARTGSSAAATTSNPNITSGDNFVFSSTFTSQEWDGELFRQQLDLTTGKTSSVIDWAAQALLDANTTRTIYTFDSAATNKLQAFSVTNFGSDANFTTPNISPLSQFCAAGPTCLSSTNQTNASGNNLVSFLRGDRTNEGIATDNSKFYHQRTHVLGDIVNAEAVYVKSVLYNYSDFGYSAFAASNATRTGVVYVAANDGMLHAFKAGGTTVVTGDGSGEELWAYIPSQMLPNLYKLADKNYAGQHQYYVDGTPVVGDICLSTSDCTTAVSAQWRTILVGGFNNGGRGYYALDVTDPAAPKALWEFTDANMGKTYGNPKITKLKNGTWVVLVTSGYNNVSPGDGQGRLYVLDATTGLPVTSINGTGTINTGVGSAVATVAGCSAAPCPSGLAKIAVRVVNPSSDNTALEVYGGDLLGNLWRFDVNDDIGAAGFDAQLLAVLRGPSGNYQPITSKPEVGSISGYSAVFVGTGSYLGGGDLSDTTQQSIYAIKDPLTGTSPPSSVAIYDNPRSFGGFVQQTQTTTTCPVSAPTTLCASGQIVRTSSNNVVNFATDNGWFFDLPDGVGGTIPSNGSERANTDPVLALGTLGFTTNVPNSNACTVGGYSYRYFLDYRTGAAVSTSTGNVVGTRLGNALATRPVYVRLPNNTIVELTRLSEGTTVTSNVPIGGGASATRRTSWRELTTDQ